MGEFKYAFYLASDLATILNKMGAFLEANGFQIRIKDVKTRNSLVKAERGTNHCRFEARMKLTARGYYLLLHENGSLRDAAITDEVLKLAAFLQAGQPSQPIIVNARRGMPGAVKFAILWPFILILVIIIIMVIMLA